MRAPVTTVLVKSPHGKLTQLRETLGSIAKLRRSTTPRVREKPSVRFVPS